MKWVVARARRKDGSIYRSVHKFEDLKKMNAFLKVAQSHYPQLDLKTCDFKNETPPPDSGPEAEDLGKLWCPYCAAYRVFSHEDDPDEQHCEVCYLSTKDFYIRKFNKLWPKMGKGK